MNNELQKNKVKGFLAEKTKDSAQAVIALIVVMALLAVMGLPVSVIAFFLIIAYFIWRAVSRSEFGDVKQVFEFYLSANEVLRDDERRWFGFEIYEVINRGEYILRMMPDAPPLVHFTLGALYHQIGSYKEADEQLTYILENENADEKKHLTASPELRKYVKILRKIEREPAEAPLTTAAIRALERARRNRAAVLLEESRLKVQELQDEARIARLVEEMGEKSALAPPKLAMPQLFTESRIPLGSFNSPIAEKSPSNAASNAASNGDHPAEKPAPPKKVSVKKTPPQESEDAAMHKSITDVLREVYDEEKKIP